MSRRKNPGAGPVPAPAGAVDQAGVVLEQLRAELREARGALGDLVRERKAVEQLARERAEQIIETHVNVCLAELTDGLNKNLEANARQILKYYQDMLDHYMNPKRHGMPDAPSLTEILDATSIINRALESGGMNPPDAWARASDAAGVTHEPR